MSLAAFAPSATARDPPSQKSFWTSTTISARLPEGVPKSGSVMSTPVVRVGGDVPGLVEEVRGDAGLAARHLERVPRQLAYRRLVTSTRGAQRLAPDDLTARDQVPQQRTVVAVALWVGPDADELGPVSYTHLRLSKIHSV